MFSDDDCLERDVLSPKNGPDPGLCRSPGTDCIAWSTVLDHRMIHLDRLYALGGRKFIVPSIALRVTGP